MTNNVKKIRVASRNSPLAVIQVDEIYSHLCQKDIPVTFEKVTYATMGDKDKKMLLTAGNCPDDFFTNTLDDALLNCEVDVAVHSAKDLPQNLRKGLSIFALTASVDETDSFVGTVHFNDLKDTATIGTSSEAREQSLKALKPQISIVNIRGTIGERIQLVEDGACDGIIVATAALKRLGLEHRIKDIMPWKTVPLQGQLAVVGRSDDFALKALFSTLDVRKAYGNVCLVGAGPGDPDLITVKGIKALKQADCVFYDYLAHKDLLSYAQKAEKVYVGKRKGAHALPQVELSELLKQKAMEGKMTVRLKGGDPLIFGRGAEEIEYLRSHYINVRVIPGVSSATAIPSSLGVPLTARDVSSSVAFVSGHGKNEKGADPQPIEIPNVDTIVFLMGLTKLDIILKSLREAGWKKETPILIISKGTCADEKVIFGNLGTITQKVVEQKPEFPALIIVGQTVNFYNAKSYPNGQILYTGTNPEKFQPLGDVVHLPMIHIEQAMFEPKKLRWLIDNVHQYHMILLTSRFAVKYFFKILDEEKYDLANFKDKDFLVIGKDTAQTLRQYDFEPALTAGLETSEGLLKAIQEKFHVRDKKILFPRSSLPNSYLSDELTRLGAKVEQLVVYQNTKYPKRDLPSDGIDKILFTSPSTVKNFLEDYHVIPEHWKILSKGPVTRKKLKEAGYESEVLIHD